MYCNKCGEEIKNGAIFCTKCGEKVRSQKTTNMYNNIVLDIKDKPNIQKFSARGIIIAVMIVISLTCVIKAVSSVSNEIKENNKKTIERQSGYVSFNCPYCKSYNRFSKASLMEQRKYYCCMCENCRKVLYIHKDTNTVSLDMFD